MSNFVVSARKYRPDHFNSVVGQSHITRTLKTAIKSNQLAQAFLFCGPRGVGKTSCARILAKTINCTNISADFEACDVCDSCVSFRNGTSFNIHELDAASNNSVEDIRALVEQVRYAPQAGKYKIYIIDEVHMLSSSAFNAFLKTLEEPPSYAIFILATTEKQKIIPTILSRCQIFEFHRIQVKDIASHLAYIAAEEKINFEPEALHIIAQKADGALRDALSSFDQLSIFTDGNITYQEVIDNLNILDYDYYFRVSDALLTENIPQALLIFDEILRNGFNGNDFMNGLCSHFRDIMVSKDQNTVKLLEVTEQTKSRYLDQSSRASVSFLLSALAIGNQCEINYRTSKNPRLQVELALMKMCHIPAAFKFQNNPGAGEKKNPEPSPVNRSTTPPVQVLPGLKSELVSAVKADPIGGINPPASLAPASAPLIPPVAAPVYATAIAPAAQVTAAAQIQVLPPSLPIIISPAPPAVVIPPAPPVAVSPPLPVLTPARTFPGNENMVQPSYAAPEPAPVAEKAAEPAKPKGASPVKFKLPSAADLLKRIVPMAEDEIAELLVQEEEDLRPIEFDQLVTYWKAYAYRPEIMSKVNFFTILTAYNPDLEDGRSIKIKVENSFQRDILQPEVPDLLRYLKDVFKHRSLMIGVKIIEQVEEKTQSLYSSQDRYVYLAEKNPSINEFKSRLDLEIER